MVSVEVDIGQVPSIIQEQFSGLKELKGKVGEATKKAKSAQMSAEDAKNKSVGLFHKKEAIELLQDATVDLAEAQISAAQAQEVSFEYQQKIAEITKYLFALGVSNIALNRSVVRELEMKLKGASEEELDEFARQEIIAVVKQLKAQEDIMLKQEQMQCILKEHDDSLSKKEQVDKEQDRLISQNAAQNEKHERLIQEALEADEEQDKLIAQTVEATEEHERLIQEAIEADEEQDRLIAQNAEKAKENARLIKEAIVADEEQDKLIELQQEKDTEHDLRIRELCDEVIKLKAETEQLRTNLINKGNKLQTHIVTGVAIAALVFSLVGMFL